MRVENAFEDKEAMAAKMAVPRVRKPSTVLQFDDPHARFFIVVLGCMLQLRIDVGDWQDTRVSFVGIHDGDVDRLPLLRHCFGFNVELFGIYE